MNNGVLQRKTRILRSGLRVMTFEEEIVEVYEFGCRSDIEEVINKWKIDKQIVKDASRKYIDDLDWINFCKELGL